MRRFATFGFIGFLATAAAFSGCMSPRAARELGSALGEALAAPFNGSQELAYATAAFQRKNGRWPKDYAELSNFVAHSDGFLVLSQYDRVDFSERPQGRLLIAFVPHGQTNQVSFTFSPKDVETK